MPFIQGHATPERIVFQQDGAPPHYAQVNTDWLSQNIPLVCSVDCRQNQNRGIPNQFLLEWPPYSMDMTPMDFGNLFIFSLQVVLCQINIFCHQLTQIGLKIKTQVWNFSTICVNLCKSDKISHHLLG